MLMQRRERLLLLSEEKSSRTLYAVEMAGSARLLSLLLLKVQGSLKTVEDGSWEEGYDALVGERGGKAGRCFAIPGAASN